MSLILVCSHAAIAIGDNPEVLSWALKGGRAGGSLTVAELERLASRLADFHAEAREDEQTRRFGAVAAIRANVCENFEQNRASIAALVSPQQAAEIEEGSGGFSMSAATCSSAVAPPGVSDGRVAILEGFIGAWEPVEKPRDGHVTIDTSQPLEDNIATLARQLPTWPPGLTE